MNTDLLNEIIDCLPTDRTMFRYGRDDYALMLLSYYADEGRRVADIKQSIYGRLLEKPAIKQLMAVCGHGILTRNDFNYVCVKDRLDFILSVGKWDRDHDSFSQTTRNSGNIVLQMNFNTGHDSIFNQLIGKEELRYFKYNSHPILKKGERGYYRNTLGWARMDLDFDTGEVLIEEIQTDWLRRANRYLQRMTRLMANRPDTRNKPGVQTTKGMMEFYVKQTLAPFYRIWDEAMLAAAIKFSIEELGMRRIFYHTFDTGNRLKQISWKCPPKSLYTDLPKRFCFTVTDHAPEFVLQSKSAKRKLRKITNPLWYKLVI